MKIVAPVRRALPFRTVFNLLGPMANPAGARRQVIGVYSPQAVPLVAEALAVSGHMRHVMVVHGDGGLDELSLSGESIVAEVKGTEVRQYVIRPADAGSHDFSGRPVRRRRRHKRGHLEEHFCGRAWAAPRHRAAERGGGCWSSRDSRTIYAAVRRKRVRRSTPTLFTRLVADMADRG